MNVLNEKPGEHPKDKNNNVCSAISGGMDSKKNFLTANSVRAAEKTIAERQEVDTGLMEQDRFK